MVSTCSCYRLLCDMLCNRDILWPADESEALKGCLAFFHGEHLRALQPEPELEQVSILAQHYLCSSIQWRIAATQPPCAMPCLIKCAGSE